MDSEKLGFEPTTCILTAIVFMTGFKYSKILDFYEARQEPDWCESYFKLASDKFAEITLCNIFILTKNINQNDFQNDYKIIFVFRYEKSFKIISLTREKIA